MTRVTLWCHPGQARTPEPRVSARTPTQGRTASERDVRWCGPALWPSGVLSEQLRWEHEPGVAKKADGPCVWLGSLLHFRSALCSIPPCIPPVTNGGKGSGLSRLGTKRRSWLGPGERARPFGPWLLLLRALRDACIQGSEVCPGQLNIGSSYGPAPQFAFLNSPILNASLFSSCLRRPYRSRPLPYRRGPSRTGLIRARASWQLSLRFPKPGPATEANRPASSDPTPGVAPSQSSPLPSTWLCQVFPVFPLCSQCALW